MFEQLTDKQIVDAERGIAARKRELEYAKWDAELVGRCFRIIRTPTKSWYTTIDRFKEEDYVTLEETLGVGGKDQHGHPANYVFADVVYIHIQQRDDWQLVCSGFEVSHAHRKEPYLKIQPVFYSLNDFRDYLGSWNHNIGPTKHFDEISKEEYVTALAKAVGSFTELFPEAQSKPGE